MILLFAVDENWAVGYDGGLLYRIPEDLQHYRRLTMGNISVMGRRTYESLPGKKPLPNRIHVVMTRGTLPPAENLSIVHDEAELMSTLQELNPDAMKQVYLCGGPNVAKSLWDQVDGACITYIQTKAAKADTWLHNLDEDPEFEMVSESEPHEYQGMKWTIRQYHRNRSR